MVLEEARTKRLIDKIDRSGRGGQQAGFISPRLLTAGVYPTLRFHKDP